MQTFLCYPDFNISARCLDNKRLGKQRVECLQILKTLAKGPTEVIQKVNPRTNEVQAIHRRTPWYNHPAVQMWKGYEYRLTCYTICVCTEWRRRGFDDTCLPQAVAIQNDLYGKALARYGRSEPLGIINGNYNPTPPWFGNERFHASHRSNLLRKDPTWYEQFGWAEPPDLPYVWPSKEGLM